MPSLFIFGLGYSALAVASAAQAAGFAVGGTTRKAEKRDDLRAQGIEAFLLDEIPDAALNAATHILSCVPTIEGQGDVALPLVPAHDVWLGYLSTTGVYGDYGGAWVDETSELRPTNDRLRRRVEAENAWRARGGHVFRLAGIYGPGRNAVEDVQEGTARRIEKPGQVFSRIHVDDIAQAVVSSMRATQPGALYNICDDAPAAQREVVEFACGLLGAPLPPLLSVEQAALSPLGREFYGANRRVSNSRMKRELNIALRYPTYREGLTAIAKNLNLV